jgi:nitrate/nitrite transporter NarK
LVHSPAIPAWSFLRAAWADDVSSAGQKAIIFGVAALAVAVLVLPPFFWFPFEAGHTYAVELRALAIAWWCACVVLLLPADQWHLKALAIALITLLGGASFAVGLPYLLG